MQNRIEVVKDQIKRIARHNFTRISEINKRYQTPRIEMSGAVKLALLMLRIYLLLLVALLAYKFATLVWK